MAIKSTFFGVWLALVMLVLFALYHQSRFFAVENKAIAALKRKSGSAVVRAEGLVQWRETTERQGLFDGDRLATGRRSSATVDFGPGRALVLGEDTQVQLTAIQTASRDYAFMIKLLRGSIVAEVKGKCDGCPPLIVRAGEDTINVVPGNLVGLRKKAGAKAKVFDLKGAWAKSVGKSRGKPVATVVAADFLKDKDEGEGPLVAEAAPPPAVAAPTATPTPVPAATPAPAVATGFEAEVRAPEAGLVYWTTQPLAALSNVALEFPLTLPAARPKQGDWRPLAELAGLGAAKDKFEILQPAGDARVLVPVMKLRGLAAVTLHGGLKEYSFTVRGGAEVIQGKQKVTSFSAHRLTGRILTFGELSGGPVSIGFDRLSPAADAGSPWMDAKTETSVDAAAVGVHLASSQDYAKLMPFVRGATRVGVARTGLASNDGVFVVRNQTVVAQLTGSGAEAAVDALFGALGGDFVFKGTRSALHDTRGTSSTALVDWMGALLDEGKVLYILKKNKLYPVSREFIKTNAEVARFIDAQAKAIFLEKVEILAYR